MKQMFKKLRTLCPLLLLSVTSLASETQKPGELAVYRDPTCITIVNRFHSIYKPSQSIQKSFTFLKHSFAAAFKYSQTGQYLATRMKGYPDKESIAIIDTQSQRLVNEFSWRESKETLFEIHSVTVDEESNQILAHAHHDFTNQSDTILIQDFSSPQEFRSVNLKEASDQDYFPTSGYSSEQRIGFSLLSSSSPYFFRYVIKESKELFQIINWKKNQLLNLADNYSSHSVSKAKDFNPVGEKYQSIALLDKSRINIELISFNEMERRMTPKIEAPERMLPEDSSSKPKGLLGKLKSLISLGPKESEKPSEIKLLTESTSQESDLQQPSNDLVKYDAPGPEKTIERKAVYQLTHMEQVEEFLFHPEFPLLISRTPEAVYIWNTLTGELVDKIHEKVANFKVFKHSDLLALSLPGARLRLYSLISKKHEILIDNFAHFYTERIKEFKNGDLIIPTGHHGAKKSQIYLIQGKRQNEYSFDIFTKKIIATTDHHPNRTERTIVKTQKGDYFIDIYTIFPTDNNDGTNPLKIDVYSIEDQKLIKTLQPSEYEDFHGQFLLSPYGDYLTLTKSETESTILELEKLLIDNGL